MTRLLTIVLLAAAFAAMLAQGKSVPSKGTAAESFELVRNASKLDDSAVGIAGVRTLVYKAFSQLYAAGKESQEHAKRLIAEASPAGKVYGYLILRHVSPADAKIAAKQLAEDGDEVEVMNGCIISHFTVSKLVTRIENGEGVIQLPK